MSRVLIGVVALLLAVATIPVAVIALSAPTALHAVVDAVTLER